MKKTGKLAVLFLILAMLCGVFAVVSSADYSTKVMLDKDCASGGTASGRIHTNEADGNSYLSYVYVSSPDVYDFGVTENNAFDGRWTYLTLDYDLMTETFYQTGAGTQLYIMTRDASGAPKGVSTIKVASNADGTAKIIPMGKVPEGTRDTYEIPGGNYEWVHITHVLKIDSTVSEGTTKEVTADNSVLLTYVNGELAFTQESVVYLNTVNIVGFRVQSAVKAESDATTCVDNVKMVLLGKGYDGNLTKLFDGKEHTLDEEDYDVVYNKNYKVPLGKKRAGVYNLAGYETIYDKAQKAFEAAKDGYEVKLYEDISNVTIDHAITVNANGYNFSWKPGNFAVTTSERDGNTIYTFRRTDRFAYFTFYPDGPLGAPEGVNIPVPVGCLPVYDGSRLKREKEDADGYYVFKEWVVFGETPLTAVTAGDVDSYFDLYPSYQTKKAPSTGKLVYSNNCEKGGLSNNAPTTTYAKSGLVTANGNTYYRYYATPDSSGNANPAGTSGFIAMNFGRTNLDVLSYFVIEFDISSEDVPAEGFINHTGRISAGNPNGSTSLNFSRKDGKLVLSVGNSSVTLETGEWAHVTVVSQSRGTTGAGVSTAFFINGKRLTTLNTYWGNGSAIIMIDDYRFIPAVNNPEGATLCFDNVTLQTFDKKYTGSLSELFDDRTTDLNKKMYRDVMWSTDYELPRTSPAARVNGVEYGSITEALGTLEEGGTLELLRDLTSTLVIDRPMTLVTNGFRCDFTHAGFDTEETERGVYVFTKTTKKAYFTFYNLDGSVLAEDVPALYGSMPSPGIGFTAAVETEHTLLMFTGWMRDGSPLTRVSEEDADGHFHVYPQTRTVTDYCAYIYDNEGNVSVVTDKKDIPKQLVSATNGATFVFATDYYIASKINVGNVYIDLNGHMITAGGDAEKGRYSLLGINGITRIYSSKKGGCLRIKPIVVNGVEQNQGGKDGTMPIFDSPVGDLVLGSVYNPTLNKTFDGDNLTIAGGCLINSVNATYSVTINGGHYFSVLGDYAAPFITRTDLKNFTISNAEIYTNRTALIAFQNANGAEIHIDNCRIYMLSATASIVASTPGAAKADPSGTLYLTNTEVYGGNVNVGGAKGRIVVGENCVIPALGSLNTKLAAGLMIATRTTRFAPSEELTNFIGRTLNATSSAYVTNPKDLVTVIWQDGMSDKWLVGTLPSHTGVSGKIVVDGWLCSMDGTWTFKDAEGNILDFDVLPESMKGGTVYAETNVIREKEVYATITYGSTVEYFYAGTIAEIGTRLMAIGADANNNSAITVTFHRDMTDATGLFTGSKDNRVSVYIDLNGHRVEAKKDFYSFKGSTNYYIYSSKPGAVIKTDGNLAYNYSRNNSHVYVGTVTALDGNTYDGDNLTVYAARLYNNGTWGDGVNTYNYHINGGTYYLTNALFAMDAKANLNVTLENATFFAKGSIVSIGSGRTATMNMTGCNFYFAPNVDFIASNVAGTGTLNVTDSSFYGVPIGKAGSFTLNLSGNVALTHMPLGYTAGNGLCMAHAPTETVTYTDGNGTTHTYTVAYRMAKLTDVVTVEWKSGAVSSKDYWLPGTTITCAISVSASIDTSDDRYAFIPNGEWTYVMNGGIVTDLAVKDYMAGAAIVATPRVERIEMSFVVIRPDGKIEAYTATDFATFKRVVEAIADASRVIMHTDYIDIPNAKLYLNGNGIELDINGHTYTTSTKVGIGNLINVTSGKTAYVYSSKPGAHLRSTTGGFAMRVLEKSTLKVGTDAKGTVYDRENFLLSGTSAIIVLNGTAYFSNITYLADVGDNTGLFQFNHSIGKLTIDNCRIVSTVKHIFGGRSGNGFTATVKNSEIYIKGGFALTQEYHGSTETASSGTATIENTLIFAETGSFTVHAQFPVTFGAGCRFVTDAKVANTTLTSGLVYARVTPAKAITLYGTTYESALLYELCASANTATVTWKNGTSETKEFWKKGEIPTNATEISTSDKYIKGIYRCDAPLTADITVEPTYTFLLPMKENLTLTANFIYNLYIPADASEITSVTIDGKAYTLDKTVEIDGETYYVISYTDITPRDAAKDITVVITAKASDGTPYEKTLTLSVFGYAEKLLAGDPSKETEQLVVDMLAYLRAAYCYFTPAADRDTARVDALLEGRTPSTPTYGEKADLGTLSKVLFGASLSLDGTPAFAFRVKSDFRGILTVSYTDNSGNVVSRDFDYTEGGDAYILVTMSVADMRKPITLTAKNTDGSTVIAEGSYDLDTYVAGIKADVIPDFAARLYAYAASAEAYLKAGN